MSSVIAVWAAAAATADGIARFAEIAANAAMRGTVHRSAGRAAADDGRAVAIPAGGPEQALTGAVRMTSPAELAP
jgi:hypothetical protein